MEAAAEGVVIVGPLGLAGILETRLGLAQPDEAQPVRIAEYLRALDAMCSSGDPFFKASYLADGWATAKRLLAERDQLVLAGWSGMASGAPRLDALVELHASTECVPGLPDRLVRILEALYKHEMCGIDRLELETPRECWPMLWRRIFDALQKAGTDISETLCDVAAAPIPGDCLPRVVPLRASTLCEAADAVAAWLAARPDNDQVLLIVEAGGELLDAALRGQGLPVTGAVSRSIHRSTLQLLPLALELCWSPFSPAALLDFLTVPLCPLHPAMGRRLVRALEKHPGLGGPVWLEALEKCRTWAATRPNSDVLSDDLGFWTGLKRYARGGEIDVQAILAICERLSAWASERTFRGSAHLLAPASAMAQSVAEAVRASGRRGFTKPQLDRILDSVAGGGLAGPALAEAAPWAVANHPGQVRGAFQDVIWWNFSDPGQQATRPLWDNAEQAALRSGGTDLEDRQRLSDLEAAAWHRPLFLASGRLVLVMADSDKGQPLLPHPLWDELAVAAGDESLLLTQAEDAASVGRGPDTVLCGRALFLEEVLPAPPVEPKRTWPAPGHIDARRATESPTGMAKLLECPLRWFLEYALSLYRGHLSALPDGNQLFGSFCHRLVEMLVAERPAWDPQAARSRAERLFDELIGQMAAALKLPGRDAELALFRMHALEAVEKLFERIRSAKLTIQGCEQRLERRDGFGQAYVGYADLVVLDGKGSPMPWDLKWTDNAKYRRQELEEERALQLAAYSWMLGVPSAHAAYFMLKQAELISTAAPWATAQEAVQTDLAVIWEKSLMEYRRQGDALRKGEAIATGVVLDGQEPPDPEPRCRYCDYSTICGVRHAD